MTANIEIINMVEGFLKNTSKILLDMKSLNFAYSNMFDETDVNCQRYLKQSLLENIQTFSLFALLQEINPNGFVLPMAKVKLLKIAFKIPTITIRIFFK